MALNAETLRRYLVDEHQLDPGGVSDESSLFSTSLLDSFIMIELITFIEEEGGFRVKPSEVTLENLDSIGAILAYAERRKAK